MKEACSVACVHLESLAPQPLHSWALREIQSEREREVHVWQEMLCSCTKRSDFTPVDKTLAFALSLSGA